LGDMVNELAPVAEKVLVSLNDRLVEAKTTIARINDVLDDSNRQNISASLANVNAMLNDVRPKMEATLANVQTATDRLPAISKNLLAASERITPVLDDLKATIKQGNDTLAHVDALVVENRPDIRALLVQMRKTLDTTNLAMDQLRSTMDRNGENLDESLANVRAATDNLKDLTDTVKRKPSVLIRGETGKDRLPGGTK
jgi:phospholipid/cholesterol/gamma-HCH transport system substrate-binding protein